MANRFIRLIEEGTIATEGELKSAYRAQALATHPDLQGGAIRTTGTLGEDFIKARAEYEAALRYLAPKDGQSKAGSGGSGHGNVDHGDRPATAFGKKRDRFDRALFYADLAALIKAGFPKVARHDKERRKYARLRLHVRSNLAALDGQEHGSCVARFDAFERSLTAIKADSRDQVRDTSLDMIIGLVEDIIDYAECGIVPLRASIEIELATLRARSNDSALLGFLAFLVADMDGGTTIL